MIFVTDIFIGNFCPVNEMCLCYIVGFDSVKRKLKLKLKQFRHFDKSCRSFLVCSVKCNVRFVVVGLGGNDTGFY